MKQPSHAVPNVSTDQAGSLAPESQPGATATGKAATNSDEQKLERQQGLLPLTLLGVGAVISGDFFGWNFGLDRGGYGGLIISSLLVGCMYICISLSLAELASMYPSAEGAFAFSRQAFGPFAGFLCGLSESLEYVLLVPVIITGLGDHLNLLFGIDNPDIQIVWWLVLCSIYLILHLWGPQPTFWSNTVITMLSLITLVIFWCVCLSVISDEDNYENDEIIDDRLYNIGDGDLEFLPNGVYGIFTSLVFASWFFIAVEELPLAGEDAINPTVTIPRALIGSIVILMITAFLTSFFAVSMPGGAYNISNTGAPLVRSLVSGLTNKCVNYNQVTSAETVCNGFNYCEWDSDEETCLDKTSNYKDSVIGWEIVINIGTLIGLLTSCHAVIFAGGRQLMSLTRNGTFPKFTRFDQIRNGTPRIALSADICLSFIISLIVYLIGEGVDFLVGLSVCAACLSYIFSMCSFVKLRIDDEKQVIERPYKSPLGNFGAIYAAIMSFLVCISFFVDIAVGLGAVILVVVLCAFGLIYALLSFEFLKGCGKNKPSGIERFIEYENTNGQTDE